MRVKILLKSIKNIKNINLHPKFVPLIERNFFQYYKTLKSLLNLNPNIFN